MVLSFKMIGLLLFKMVFFISFEKYRFIIV
jgi:hypothetical protein